jgi:hypothetical protein
MLKKVKTTAKSITRSALNYLSAEPALYAAMRFNNLSLLKVYLNSGLYDVDDNNNELGMTALMSSVLHNKPVFTVELLKHKADPKKVDKDGTLAIQYAIYDSNTSNVKLLAMHGATTQGVKFIKNGEATRLLLLEMITVKQNYDTLRHEAKQCSQLEQYEQALIKYKQAGDIWYHLCSEETIEEYRTYYQEKALNKYKKAAVCFDCITIQNITEELQNPCQELYGRLKTLSHVLGLKQEEQHYTGILQKLQRLSKLETNESTTLFQEKRISAATNRYQLNQQYNSQLTRRLLDVDQPDTSEQYTVRSLS